jgi:hypothetical protein
MGNSMKDFRNNMLPAILIGISSTGIAISLIFPVAYNLILLIFCILLRISTRNLTKNLILKKFDSLFWIPAFVIGIISLISLLTPDSYYTLVIQIPYVDNVHWLWQFQLGPEQVQTITFFYIPIILISGLIMVCFSLKKMKRRSSLADNPWLLRIVANILIIFPLILYNGKIFNFGISYIVITPGFAVYGPLFCGFMIKDQMKIHQKEVELSFTNYELKRNKMGFGVSLAVGLIFLLVGCNISNIQEYILQVFSPLIPIHMAVFLINYYVVILLLIGSLIVVLPFFSNSYPRFVAIFLLILRRTIILHSFPLILIFNPVFLKTMFLILYIPGKISIVDTVKTFNLLKSKI